MTKHKLSIIIPCYNCTSTLEEALISVYTQNFTTPFEVIMVNDGSTDNTLDLIKVLAKKYPHIVFYSHDKNKGGGATRNTGISKSTGDLIYCLDSDNIFAPNTMQKMIDYIDEKKCDAVAFYERRFFVNKNKEKYIPQYYKIGVRAVEIEDFFGKEPVLLDNFLFTKDSYYKTDGYPENHGFDTQCFELRYLASGGRVYFCPDTSFYHRQIADTKSYFERVYESGEFSKNLYLIYEDIFFLFSPILREKIIQYDIFKNSSMESINKVVQDFSINYKEDFFIEDYRRYLIPNGYEMFVKDNLESTELTDLFCFAVYYYKNNDYDKALDIYKKIVGMEMYSKIVYYNILRVFTAISLKDNKVEVEKKVLNLIGSMQVKIPDSMRVNVFIRAIRKLKRIVKKILRK
ncbi:MAG: glycosyltransferase family 2 protein [Minisyncoccia bacterium]